MTPRRPLFSIVVPTYRRPKQLKRLLEALAALEYPRDQFEAIIVDDGSPEPPLAVVREFSSRVRVSLLTQRHAGPAAARNAGAEHASGLYVCFTDDDCAPAADWLTALERRVRAFPQRGVGGRIVNALGGDVYSTTSHDLVTFLSEYYNASPTGARFFTTINLTLPREMFLEIGGFDSSFPLPAAEDRDLCERWREQGYGLELANDVVVGHAHAMNLGAFCRQHFNYGRGAVYLHRARERRGLYRPRLEPLRFYLRLLGHPLGQGYGIRTPAIVALMALSQATYAAGYYWGRAQALRKAGRARDNALAEDAPRIVHAPTTHRSGPTERPTGSGGAPPVEPESPGDSSFRSRRASAR